MVGLLAVAALRPPPRVQALWCRLRLGAEPVAGGLVLTLGPAPPALRGEGPGPWLLVEVVNTGPREQEAWLARPPGEELELLVDGEPAPPDPGRATTVHPLARVRLRPGERVGQVLDAGAHAALPPGRHRLAVRRHRLPGLDDLEATSGALELELP